MIKNADKNNEQFKNLKIKTYYFKEEADEGSNGRKTYFPSKQGNNDYEVDAIMIRKYYEN